MRIEPGIVANEDVDRCVVGIAWAGGVPPARVRARGLRSQLTDLNYDRNPERMLCKQLNLKLLYKSTPFLCQALPVCPPDTLYAWS